MLCLVKFFIFLVIILFGSLIFIKSFDYYIPNFTYGYLSDKKLIFDGIFKYGLYFHIITVPIILFTGSIQAIFRYEIKFKQLHRAIGKVYCYLILFISAPGAFILSFYAFGGLFSKLSFLVLTTLWFWFTYSGLKKGNLKDIEAHKKFMIRSYILTLSAIFLRIISYIFSHFYYFKGELAYTIASWISWLPFLILTEIFFYHNSFKIPLNTKK